MKYKTSYDALPKLGQEGAGDLLHLAGSSMAVYETKELEAYRVEPRVLLECLALRLVLVIRKRLVEIPTI